MAHQTFEQVGFFRRQAYFPPCAFDAAREQIHAQIAQDKFRRIERRHFPGPRPLKVDMQFHGHLPQGRFNQEIIRAVRRAIPVYPAPPPAG